MGLPERFGTEALFDGFGEVGAEGGEVVYDLDLVRRIVTARCQAYSGDLSRISNSISHD